MATANRIKGFAEFNNSLTESANGRLDSSELVPIEDVTGKSAGHKLNPEAAAAYNAMVAAAKADGIEWGITDSYRPYEVQNRIFDWDLFNRTGKKLKKGAGVPAAYPGTSNHGWGSAVDIKVKYGDPAWNWLTANAAKFGFSNPFSNPKTEPWHWEHKASAGKTASSASSVIPTSIVIDSDLVSRLIAKLKEKGFSQTDLEKFSVKKTSTGEPVKGERSKGSGGKISESNIELLYDAMDKYGISNKYAREAILGVISKESADARAEVSYINTPNDRIRKIFGSRIASVSDAELNRWKKDFANDPEKFSEKFFNKVYANIIGNGDEESGDGYRYRGRGFNGITGKGNYKSLQELYKGGDVDIVANPELLDKPEIAAEFAVLYFIRSFNKRNKSMNEYTNIEDAVRDFVQANHGWGHSIDDSMIGREGYAKALDYAKSRIDTAASTA